jgi:hypothetical protein
MIMLVHLIHLKDVEHGILLMMGGTFGEMKGKY